MKATWAPNLASGIKSLRQTPFHLIISNLELSDSSGIETIASIHNEFPRIPILALTNHLSFDYDRGSVEVIRAGATDYMPKDEITENAIARAVIYTLERHQMSKKLQEQNELLNEVNVRLEAKNERLAQMYNMSQQFVDNVSHEFRTPLTVIREFAGIIKDGIDGPVTTQQAKRLDSLIGRTEDLANMVDDLLDTSRLESGLIKANRKKQKLKPIIDQVFRTLQSRANAKSISLNSDISSPGLHLFCDEEKLRRVLINLIVNAIKFTPRGGEIVVSSKKLAPDRASISVTDDGPGIPTFELNRIFERFQQVNSNPRMASCKGFGLGLSIARSLASLNLGRLQVASVEGQGSTFSVTVPLANPRSVMNCYLEQLRFDSEDLSNMSLVEISLAEADVDEATVEIVDDFVHNNVTATDLVMRPLPETWQAFLKCNFDEVDPFIQRLDAQWARQKRNHYGDPLPNLQFKRVATVDVRSHPMGLVNLIPTRFWSVSEKKTWPEKKHILVIDDEADLANAIQLRLEAKGFRVSTAHDGRSGLDAVAAMKPDAILIDMRMPGMDGLDVLENLKSNPESADTPIVALSASSLDKDTILEKGAAFFVQKPFQSNAIMHAIESVLEPKKLPIKTTHRPHILKGHPCKND